MFSIPDGFFKQQQGDRWFLTVLNSLSTYGLSLIVVQMLFAVTMLQNDTDMRQAFPCPYPQSPYSVLKQKTSKKKLKRVWISFQRSQQAMLLFGGAIGELSVVSLRNPEQIQSFHNILMENQVKRQFENLSGMAKCEQESVEVGRDYTGQIEENNGKWSDEEHAMYVAFIEFYREKMRSKSRRRLTKFYKLMAGFIQTRNSLQCRSHHQKLEEKYHFPNKIISNFKKNYDSALYQTLMTKLRQKDPSHSSNRRPTVPSSTRVQPTHEIISPEVINRKAQAQANCQTEMDVPKMNEARWAVSSGEPCIPQGWGPFQQVQMPMWNMGCCWPHYPAYPSYLSSQPFCFTQQ